MDAFRIKKHIESEVLRLSVPKEFIGKYAEIIVLVESDNPSQNFSATHRRPGSAKGMIWMAEDFEKPMDDEKLEGISK
jgi:hypothetical protein